MTQHIRKGHIWVLAYYRDTLLRTHILAQSIDLDVGAGMNLVYGITGSTAGLMIEVVTHDKHTVIAQTS